MALGASALTTLANAKAVLGISVSTYDSLIEQYIDRASAQIETATDRLLKARNYNGNGTNFSTTSVTSEDYIYFSGSTMDQGGDTVVTPEGRSVFYLPQFPIQTASPSITFALHVLMDRPTSDWDSSSYVENTDYVVDRQKGILTLLGGCFEPGIRNYRVTCTAGYLTSAAPYVPADLEQLCIALVKKMFRNESGVTSESLGTWSKSYDVEKADEQIEATMSKYRKLSL